MVAYNPLDKLNLAKSIESEILARPTVLLGEVGNATGAGVYAIYYSGPFPAYAPIMAANKDGAFAKPIYVGKAIPKGGRKGGLAADVASTGRALSTRLRQHARSIEQATNLDLSDFHVRYLVVDDVWIPLGENMLIETFQPIWNRVVDGFGIHVPGKGRSGQVKSSWDVLHPGRDLAKGLPDSPVTVDFLSQRIEDSFAGRPLAKLPKALADQQAEQAEEAAKGADELGTEEPS